MSYERGPISSHTRGTNAECGRIVLRTWGDCENLGENGEFQHARWAVKPSLNRSGMRVSVSRLGLVEC